MILNALLAQARRQTVARKQRARERQQRQDQAAGRPVRLSKVEKIERIAAAWTCQDYLTDLDRFLVARGCDLYIVWQGRHGQCYLRTPEGNEVLMHADRKRRTVKVCYTGEYGQRLARIMDQHRVEMTIGWASGRLVLQAGSREVSDVHCLRLIEVTDGRKCRYMRGDEQEVGS